MIMMSFGPATLFEGLECEHPVVGVTLLEFAESLGLLFDGVEFALPEGLAVVDCMLGWSGVPEAMRVCKWVRGNCRVQ